MNRRSALELSPGAAGPVLSAEVIVPLASVLVRPAEEHVPWQKRALCAGADPGPWFPGKGTGTAEAKRVCQSCPVRVQCLEFALANGERHGVWGGLSERERRPLARPRERQRREPGAGRAWDPIPDLRPAELARFRSRLGPGACGTAWTGTVDAEGKARFAVYRDGRSVKVQAHRLAFKLATGTDPGNAEVLRACGISLCCTPGCLVLGSRAGSRRSRLGVAA